MILQKSRCGYGRHAGMKQRMRWPNNSGTSAVLFTVYNCSVLGTYLNTPNVYQGFVRQSEATNIKKRCRWNQFEIPNQATEYYSIPLHDYIQVYPKKCTYGPDTRRKLENIIPNNTRSSSWSKIDMPLFMSNIVWQAHWVKRVTLSTTHTAYRSVPICLSNTLKK